MESSEHLEDVAIRARQLEAHLLHSPEYLHRWDQAIKRQVSMLYLAIALLVLFQGIFTLKSAGQLPVSAMALTTITALLAVINCLLLIRTKHCLRKLNNAWLRPEEKIAVDSLRHQREEILAQHLADSPHTNAALN